MPEENKSPIDTAAEALTQVGKSAAAKPHASIAAALADFQKEIPVPIKDADANYGKFAPLDVVTTMATAKLSDLGIAWTAAGGYREGQYGVIGQLLHTSGESLDGFFPVIATKPQDIGSAFTYARRYLLMSLTGIAPAGEDDDGKQAQESAVRQEQVAVQRHQAAAVEDALAPLKKRVQELLVQSGDLDASLEGDALGKRIKELGDAFFGRSGWAQSDVALTKWITALEAPVSADPSTGEVKG